MAQLNHIKILAAPLQGITDVHFRQQHYRQYGGVDEYYTPFARLEKGRLRDKDRRDLLPERNRGVPTVAQVIAKDREEFARLCDLLQHLGWDRIDLNMGCPFPMQYNSGRGSGLLPHPDRVAEIVEEMRSRREVTFSVKMRLGLAEKSESLRLLPLLNEAPLQLVTLHARVGIQQYKGTVDLEGFETFYEGCAKPMAYNGNQQRVEEIAQTVKRFPRLVAVMLGRGLIERPQLGREWKDWVKARYAQ
jgi:tRNA-dihydrouridine synthase